MAVVAQVVACLVVGLLGIERVYSVSVRLQRECEAQVLGHLLSSGSGSAEGNVAAVDNAAPVAGDYVVDNG